MAGYSGTPLPKKIGIREGFRVWLVNAPKGFEKELGKLPPRATLSRVPLAESLDVILLFVESQKVLKQEFAKFAGKLLPNGMLWVAWPKKSSGVSTDLSFEEVQQVGLQAGLVDVKICAIDDIWSGLKFVYRVKDRSTS